MFLRRPKPPSPLRQISKLSETDLEVYVNGMLDKSKRALERVKNLGTLVARSTLINNAINWSNTQINNKYINEDEARFVLMKFKEKLNHLSVENHAMDAFSRSKNTILNRLSKNISFNINDFTEIIFNHIIMLHKDAKITASEQGLILGRYIELLNTFCDEQSILKPKITAKMESMLSDSAPAPTSLYLSKKALRKSPSLFKQQQSSRHHSTQTNNPSSQIQVTTSLPSTSSLPPSPPEQTRPSCSTDLTP